MSTYLAPLLVLVADSTPEDDDVVAGGWGALVIVLLVLATIALLFSFTRQLRKTQAAKEAGVFDESGE